MRKIFLLCSFALWGMSCSEPSIGFYRLFTQKVELKHQPKSHVIYCDVKIGFSADVKGYEKKLETQIQSLFPEIINGVLDYKSRSDSQALSELSVVLEKRLRQLSGLNLKIVSLNFNAQDIGSQARSKPYLSTEERNEKK